jgi:indole-3-glycerol phosphate synthase
VVGVKDKLTEIMAWKREEIAPQVREVSERELAALNASLPRPPRSTPRSAARTDGSP